MHQGVLWAAFPVSAWVAYRAWRLGRSRLVELAVIVGLGVVSNAWITGVFSNVLGRYQARVAWLAVAVGLQLFGIGRRTEPSPGEEGHGSRDPGGAAGPSPAPRPPDPGRPPAVGYSERPGAARASC